MLEPANNAGNNILAKATIDVLFKSNSSCTSVLINCVCCSKSKLTLKIKSGTAKAAVLVSSLLVAKELITFFLATSFDTPLASILLYAPTIRVLVACALPFIMGCAINLPIPKLSKFTGS